MTTTDSTEMAQQEVAAHSTLFCDHSLENRLQTTERELSDHHNTASDNLPSCSPKTPNSLKDLLIGKTTTPPIKAESKSDSHLGKEEAVSVYFGNLLSTQEAASNNAESSTAALSPCTHEQFNSKEFLEQATETSTCVSHNDEGTNPQHIERQVVIDQQPKNNMPEQPCLEPSRPCLHSQKEAVQPPESPLPPPSPYDQEQGHSIQQSPPSPSQKSPVSITEHTPITIDLSISTADHGEQEMASSVILYPIHQDLLNVMRECQKALSSIHERAIASLNEVFHTAQESFQVFIDSVSTASLPGYEEKMKLRKLEKNVEDAVDEFVAKVKDELESEDEEMADAYTTNKKEDFGHTYTRECTATSYTTQSHGGTVQSLSDQKKQVHGSTSSSSAPTMKRLRSPITRDARRDNVGGDNKHMPSKNGSNKYNSSKRSDNRGGYDKDEQSRKRHHRDNSSRPKDSHQYSRSPERHGARHHVDSHDTTADLRSQPASTVLTRPKGYQSSTISSASPPPYRRLSSRGGDSYIPRYGRPHRTAILETDSYRPASRDMRNHDSVLKRR